MTNEQKALALGNNRTRLRGRLMNAKAVLDRGMALLFSDNTFDFENKRLVSDSGRFALQWRIRLHPDQPESYENQQTNCGTVVFMQLSALATKESE
jgi:hypothetical protein